MQLAGLCLARGSKLGWRHRIRQFENKRKTQNQPLAYDRLCWFCVLGNKKRLALLAVVFLTFAFAFAFVLALGALLAFLDQAYMSLAGRGHH